MIVLIDHSDSFTYNLAHAFGTLGQEVTVLRHDQCTIEEIKQHSPDYLVLSSGAYSVRNKGITYEVITEFAGEVPMLGVGLGNQLLVEVFGGNVVPAKKLVHGKKVTIVHDGHTIFKNLSSPFQAACYHSIVVNKKTLPSSLVVSAQTEDGELMGWRHRELRVEGVQFHPESYLTEEGQVILRNFIEIYCKEEE